MIMMIMSLFVLHGMISVGTKSRNFRLEFTMVINKKKTNN